MQYAPLWITKEGEFWWTVFLKKVFAYIPDLQVAGG